MTDSIHRVAVLGAGTMGAGIAAHVANAGLPVLLLDVVPEELTAEEQAQGLTLASSEVRNRTVRQGLERARRLRPAPFMGRAAERLLTLGNFEDDFHRLAEVDWIVEAVVERLAVKQELMERLEAVVQPGAVVTTNTSGLPIARIGEGRSEAFRRHLFGTHFFNPPRQMKLLEVIPGEAADPEAVERIATFANRRLGKGVVFSKDTPNFIGNRIASIHSCYLIDWALTHGYSVEEVDAITGPLIGRPKTATFRLQDLVGIDVAHFVARNLHELIPEDPCRGVLHSEELARVVGGLLTRGWLGKKTGQGFYRRLEGSGDRPLFEVLDPQTFEYRPPREVRFPAVAAVRELRDPGERLRALFADAWAEDRGARLAWTVVSHLLLYAAARAPEIAYDLESVDRALTWGFGYALGPFELWDRLGVRATLERLEAEGPSCGLPVAGWVREMLAAGCESFYRLEGDRVTGVYDWEMGGYVDLDRDPRQIRIADLRAAGAELTGNSSASLLDLGDGVLLLEFHSKMNTLDAGTVEMMVEAVRRLADTRWKGLVIGNDGQGFSAGANLGIVAGAAREGRLDDIREAARVLQGVHQSLRFAPAPVVVAIHGLTLGGGTEMALAAPRVVAAAESYMGLVEAGVGLLPAGGGLKELVRRRLSPAMEAEATDPLPLAQEILETVAAAKISGSAAEARELGLLGPDARIVMNRDHLLQEAKAEVLAMAAAGWAPPSPALLWAGGRNLLAALELGIRSRVQAGQASEHDTRIGREIARVLAGGDGSAPAWLPEEHFLALERSAFAELAGTETTQARIANLLGTGKRLRNGS